MKIYFDGIEIDGGSVMYLKQSARLYENKFRLGATLCIEVVMHIIKTGVLMHPNEIQVEDDEGALLYTLQVDSIDTSNDQYYSYNLTDKMINFNVVYDWSVLENPTVQNILDTMCLQILGTPAPTVSYMANLRVTWSENITCRDFISYVAEVNSSFARLSPEGRLEFVTVNKKPTATINMVTCKDIKIGSTHNIDRVVYENGVATAKYPSDENYTGSGETYYVNSDNILITDNGGYTREGIIETIYNAINGFVFTNLTTTRCELPDGVKAGDIIMFQFPDERAIQKLITREENPIITDDSYYIGLYALRQVPTIAQLEWEYFGGWYGGFELEVDNALQEETDIISKTERAIKDLKILIDRENGLIRQEISDIEGNISALQQTSEDIQATFVRKNDEDYQQLVTNLRFDADGINLSSNNVDTNLQITSDGVYIRDSQNKNITTMQKNQFTMGEWIMQQSSDVLNIFKEH